MNSVTKRVIAGLTLLILAWTGYLIFSQEWEKIEIVTGLSSQARKDPFLVINRLLEPLGSGVRKADSVDNIINGTAVSTNPENTALILDERVLNPLNGHEYALLQWVDQGGELIYLVADSSENTPLMWIHEELSVAVQETDNSKGVYRDLNNQPQTNAYLLDESGDSLLKLYFPHELHLQGCPDDSWSVVNKTLQTLLCQVPYGLGHVTIAVTLDFIGNQGIQQLQNASLATWLLSQKPQTVYVGKTSDASLLGKIWVWSANLLVLSLLWLILAVWHLASRFGPALTPRFERYNHFGLHIEALGRYYSQNGHDNKLQTALRDDIEARMEKHKADFRKLGNAAKSEIFSEKTDTDPSNIQLLFDKTLPEDQHLRTRYVQSIQSLRKKL